jgi:prepilin-type N-terminal cleavage/methylation domain-containing protein
MACSVSRRGFSLIELLVVIAILSILAALLFPVFAKARAKANQTRCVNNQRQVAIAILSYVQDHDQLFFADSGDAPWSVQLAASDIARLLDCPLQGGAATAATPEYGFNGFLFGVAEGDVRSPATTVLTADLRRHPASAPSALRRPPCCSASAIPGAHRKTARATISPPI